MVVSVADAPATAVVTGPRKRLGRREKAERRAKDQPAPAEADNSPPGPPGGAEVDSSTAVWPWHSLAEPVSATVPVVFSQDGS